MIYNSVEQSIKHESRSGESGRGETVEVGGALPALLATGHDHTAAAASEWGQTSPLIAGYNLHRATYKRYSCIQEHKVGYVPECNSSIVFKWRLSCAFIAVYPSWHCVPALLMYGNTNRSKSFTMLDTFYFRYDSCKIIGLFDTHHSVITKACISKIKMYSIFVCIYKNML